MGAVREPLPLSDIPQEGYRLFARHEPPPETPAIPLPSSRKALTGP